MDLQIDTAIERQEDMEETDHLHVGTRQEDMTTEGRPLEAKRGRQQLGDRIAIEEEAHRHL
jgi:hypothetical protein